LFEVGAGIAGGILLLVMSRAWMMLLSAAVGAVMFVWGVQISLVYALLFFILGIVVQSLLSRAMGERAYEQASEAEHPPMINE
jgi:fatty acid desaturase